MSARAIRIITGAADVGNNPTVNRAAMDACRKGILRNISLMVPCAHAREAADMFAAERGINVGIHATVNAEWARMRWGPVLPPERVPSLVDADGLLPRTTTEMFERGVDEQQLLAEIQAQLDRAREWGVDVKYMDAHMGYATPNWSGWVTDAVSDRLQALCEKEGVIFHMRARWDYLPRVEQNGDKVQRFVARLKAAGPGQYNVSVHPAYATREMHLFCGDDENGARVARDRDAERLMFMDERVLEVVKARGIEPIRYDEAELVS